MNPTAGSDEAEVPPCSYLLVDMNRNIGPLELFREIESNLWIKGVS